MIYSHSVTFLVTFVYPKNSATNRKELWTKFYNIAINVNEPWIVIGDFNCFHKMDDKLGGLSPSPHKLTNFNNCINDCGLLDLPNYGLSYSWFNQQVDYPIHCLLDRALVNDKWIDSHPSSFYKVMSPLTFDHSPIMIFSGISSVPKRFIFEIFWSKCTSFQEIILETWNIYVVGDHIFQLCNKLQNIKKALKKAN